MKKVLLGSSAIALAGAIAMPANAADWDVRVGGFYNAMVAYGTTDFPSGSTADADGVDVKTNAEIFFLPSITLDNGIKIGANVQLEGSTNGDQIDESYVQIKGSFGEINLGSENSAGYKMTYAAPNAAIISLNSPSTGDYIAWSSGLDSVFRGTLGTTFLEVGGNNDAQRITYYTPRLAGFQVGVSYARDAEQDSNTQVDLSAGSGNLGDIFDIGANYVNTFGGVDIAVSGRWGTGSQEGSAAVTGSPGLVIDAGGAAVVRDTTADVLDTDTVVTAPVDVAAAGTSSSPTVWSVGANLGFGGFTIGGSFAEQNDTNGGVDDGVAYDFGVSYGTGPWKFSAAYFHGENGEGGGTSDEQDSYMIGVNYQLAKGVRLNGFGAYVDADPAGNNNDISGFVIGTGIGLSF